MSTELNFSDLTLQGYSISTDKSLLDVASVYDFLTNESYWSQGLTYDRFLRSVENSMCFGIFHQGRTIGFARVITDKAIFAYLCDVFIREEHRGKQLSKWLIQTIINHPELQGLRRWSLATRDAHGLYKQFGFEPIPTPEVWMQIYRPFKVPQNEGTNE